MLELVYPLSPAPLLKGCVVEGNPEMFPIVETDGCVVAQAPRAFCHAGSKPLHPVVHLHIINRFSRIYLQKRPSDKDICPLCWDTAVGGHVSYGEYFEEALYREAAEELGLRDFNPTLLTSYVFESAVERELVNVYAVVGQFRLHPDPYEVADARFWSIPEIERNYGTGVLTPNFESEFQKIKDQLLALL